MTKGYAPPCRLRVKRRFLVGGLWLDPGEYFVWWGKATWVIDPVHPNGGESIYSMMAVRPR